MNLSKESHSTNTKPNQSSLTDEQEDKRYSKEVKLNQNENSIQKKPTPSELTPSRSRNSLNFTSEVFQSRLNGALFLDAIWKLEVPNLFFKFAFEEPKIDEEERTGVPICFLLKYNEKNYIDVYFQIKGKESFPREVIDSDIIYSNGVKEVMMEKPKENGCRRLDDNKNNQSAPIVNDLIVDLTQDQELEHYGNINANYYPSPYDTQPKTHNDKEYSVTIKIFIVDYCFGKFDFDLSSNETKVLRVMFTDLLASDIKNDKLSTSIITEVLVTKLPSNTQPLNYCGLVNEGTTCYMNSLLQILYMLGYFKRAIFQVKIPPRHYKTSKIYSIQKLFYDLICSDNKPISTNQLIVSFGWSRDQMLIQHDVQEFFIILAEVMENELKGTKEENTFKDLFEGKVMNQIKCIQVYFESKTEEKFTDIQLTIKNCNNIYDSFDKYTEEELLTGNDKYDTNTQGKQDAKKKIAFSSFPKVLVLQLKRFEYNAKLNDIEKINDRFEFYDTLDLKKYALEDNADMPSEYECHAVIVHVGLINNGHYYCYIQPEIGGRWVKFNDDKVSIAEHYEVFNNNYGGNIQLYFHTNNDTIVKEVKANYSNAYILIYIRKDCLKEILVKITKEDIPQDITNLFTFEKEEKEKEIMRCYRKNYFMTIDVISQEIIESEINSRITGLTENLIELNECRDKDKEQASYKRRIRLSVHKEMIIETFVSLISQITNIPKHKLFLYKYAMSNSSYLDRYNYQMKCLTDEMYRRRFNELSTFIEPLNQFYCLYIHNESSIPLFRSNQTSIDLGKDKEIQYVLNEDNNLLALYDIYSNANQDKSAAIYYNPKENNWEFTTNDHLDNPIRPSIEIKPIRERSTLVFIKSPVVSFDLDKKISIEMKLEKVYQKRPRECLNDINTKNYFKCLLSRNLSPEFKQHLKAAYDNSEIQYLIEYSCLNLFMSKDPERFLPNFILKCTQAFENYNNDAICIALSLKSKEEPQNSNSSLDLIRQLINNRSIKELTQATVSFICSTVFAEVNINQELHLPSEHIDLVLSKEEVQIKIISLIGQSLLPKLFPYRESPSNDSTAMQYKIFMKKEEKNLIDLFTKENCKIIQLFSVKHNCKKNYYSNYPLLEYVPHSTNQIRFKINLNCILNQAISLFHKLVISDEYANPTIIAYFEREKYHVPPLEVITRDYLSHNDDMYDYYFIPYNPNTLIAYNSHATFRQESIDYYQNNQKNTEIRYQPYSKKRPGFEKKKVFVCCYKNKVHPLTLPFILHCDPDRTTIREQKEAIMDIIQHNKEFLSYYEDIGKLKFYKCYLRDQVPSHLTLLEAKLDNVNMSDIFSSNEVINICVDLTTQMKENSNGSKGNKNYLSINE